MGSAINIWNIQRSANKAPDTCMKSMRQKSKPTDRVGVMFVPCPVIKSDGNRNTLLMDDNDHTPERK